jgi:hypothetical protein
MIPYLLFIFYVYKEKQDTPSKQDRDKNKMSWNGEIHSTKEKTIKKES